MEIFTKPPLMSYRQADGSSASVWPGLPLKLYIRGDRFFWYLDLIYDVFDPSFALGVSITSTVAVISYGTPGDDAVFTLTIGETFY